KVEGTFVTVAVTRSLATQVPEVVERVMLAVPTLTPFRPMVATFVAPAANVTVATPFTPPAGVRMPGALLVTVTVAGAMAFNKCGIVTVRRFVVPWISDTDKGDALMQGYSLSTVILSKAPATESPTARAYAPSSTCIP